MSKNPKIKKELSREDLIQFFRNLDLELTRRKKHLNCTLLGGAAIILLNFKDRSTRDIDVPSSQDELDFLIQSGIKYGIEVQPIAITTTVNFLECEKQKVFFGKYLEVQTISAQDLIKSKLERYQKQDLDDIDTIIKKINLSFEGFAKLFGEMLQDFVGSTDRLTMQARNVVEYNYPDRVEWFYRSFRLSYE